VLEQAANQRARAEPGERREDAAGGAGRV